MPRGSAEHNSRATQPATMPESRPILLCESEVEPGGFFRFQMLPTITKLGQLRRREMISCRSMAKRLGISRADYDELESPEHELTISELTACCEALQIPVSEFFDIEQRVPRRTNILRAYKSALTLKRMVSKRDEQVMVDRLCEDLLKVMPEMDGLRGRPNTSVHDWPAVGHRRGTDELGRTGMFPVDTSAFGEEAHAHTF